MSERDVIIFVLGWLVGWAITSGCFTNKFWNRKNK